MVSGTRSDGFRTKVFPGRDGVGQEPERNHPREIKRNDGGDHAQRLPDHHFVDAAGHVFQVVALHHGRNAAGNFDVFDSAAQFGLGLGKRLAILGGEDAGKILDLLFENVLQLEQRLNTIFSRSAPPFRKGGGRSLNRGRDFGGAGKRSLSDDLASGRVGDIEPFGGFGIDPLPVNVVRNFGQSRGSNSHKILSRIIVAPALRLRSGQARPAVRRASCPPPRGRVARDHTT